MWVCSTMRSSVRHFVWSSSAPVKVMSLQSQAYVCSIPRTLAPGDPVAVADAAARALGEMPCTATSSHRSPGCAPTGVGALSCPWLRLVYIYARAARASRMFRRCRREKSRSAALRVRRESASSMGVGVMFQAMGSAPAMLAAQAMQSVPAMASASRIVSTQATRSSGAMSTAWAMWSAQAGGVVGGHVFVAAQGWAQAMGSRKDTGPAAATGRAQAVGSRRPLGRRGPCGWRRPCGQRRPRNRLHIGSAQATLPAEVIGAAQVMRRAQDNSAAQATGSVQASWPAQALRPATVGAREAARAADCVGGADRGGEGEAWAVSPDIRKTFHAEAALRRESPLGAVCAPRCMVGWSTLCGQGPVRQPSSGSHVLARPPSAHHLGGMGGAMTSPLGGAVRRMRWRAF